jgi:hypothetical protein
MTRESNYLSRRNTIIIGEDLNWVWCEDEILEAQVMYDMGIPLDMIASNFNRPILEVAIMLAIRAEEGHLEPRQSGVYGRVKENGHKTNITLSR